MTKILIQIVKGRLRQYRALRNTLLYAVAMGLHIAILAVLKPQG